MVRFSYSCCIKWNKTCVVVSLKAVCIRVYVKNPFCETFILFQMVATPSSSMDGYACSSLPLLQFLHKLTQANLSLEANQNVRNINFHIFKTDPNMSLNLLMFYAQKTFFISLLL